MTRCDVPKCRWFTFAEHGDVALAQHRRLAHGGRKSKHGPGIEILPRRRRD